jgi:hypothetical protein
MRLTPQLARPPPAPAPRCMPGVGCGRSRRWSSSRSPATQKLTARMGALSSTTARRFSTMDWVTTRRRWQRRGPRPMPHIFSSLSWCCQSSSSRRCAWAPEARVHPFILSRCKRRTSAEIFPPRALHHAASVPEPGDLLTTSLVPTTALALPIASWTSPPI